MLQKTIDLLNEFIRVRERIGQNLNFILVCDAASGHLILLLQGWQGKKFIHKTLLHWEVQNEQLWIWHQGVDYDFTSDFQKYNIAASLIKYGFLSEEERKLFTTNHAS